jgi:hypothetical protein
MRQLKMRTAILTLSITSNDAVSNYVLSMHRALARSGRYTFLRWGWTLAEPPNELIEQ